MMHQSQIRPVAESDATLLFRWRNDVLTRKMSKKKEPVKWDDHLAWFGRRLKMDVPNLFVFELDGEPVATFRIDDNDLSYTVAPEHRNRGVARLMLNEVRLQFGRFRAHINSDNIPSIKAAEGAGMEVVIIRPDKS